MKLYQLPSAIFGSEIQSYLLFKDYHNLVASSKEHFEVIKKATVRYRITDKCSKTLLISYNSFDEYIRGLMDNPNQQLALIFRIPVGSDEAFQVMAKERCNLECSVPLAGLKLSPASLSKITLLLPNKYHLLHTLELENCLFMVTPHTPHYQIFASSNFPHRHPNLQSLIIRRCTFHNTQTTKHVLYETFGDNMKGLKKVQLIDCAGIEDCKGLNGIEELTFQRCQPLIDISDLGNHSKLVLDSCHYITNTANLSAQLANISSLSIIQCHKLTHIVNVDPSRKEIYTKDVFANVGHLYVEQGPKHGYQHLPTSNAAFSYSVKLSIESLQTINDFSLAYSVHLSRGYQIKDVNALATVKYQVVLTNFPLITNVNKLGNVPRLELHDCRALEDISGLATTSNPTVERRIVLEHCPEVNDFTALNSYARATVTHCLHYHRWFQYSTGNPDDNKTESLALMNFNGDVDGGNLKNYPRLTSFQLRTSCSSTVLPSLLNQIRYVYLVDCAVLKDLAAFNTADCKTHHVTLQCCPSIVDVAPLANVADVKILECQSVLSVQELLRKESRTKRLEVVRFRNQIIEGFASSSNECEGTENKLTLWRTLKQEIPVVVQEEL